MDKDHIQDHGLIEIPRKKELIYRGNYLEYHRDEVELPNGKTSYREYLHHPGAIAVVPILDNGDVLLVRQFRYATGQILLEIPAGKLEADEPIETAVIRELTEETGYKSEKIVHLLSTWTTPGFTDEVIHLYLATNLQFCAGQPDADEFLEVVKIPYLKLKEMVRAKEITDAKTVLALVLIELNDLWTQKT